MEKIKKYFMVLQRTVSGLTIFSLVLAQVILAGLFVFPAKALATDTAGPNNGSTFSSIDFTGADVGWTNTSNASTSNDQKASAAIGGSGVQETEYLRAKGFNFTIPSGSTIDGIQVDIERSRSTSTTGTAEVRDNIVKLVKNNVVTGTNQADTSTDWPVVDAYKTYGDTANLWGATWTVADINNANFGVVLSAMRTITGVDNQRTANVDHVRMTVYYTPDTRHLQFPQLCELC